MEKFMLLAMSSMMPTSFHPIMMVMIIMVTTCMSSILMFTITKNQWIPYILILAFLGGMMILFLYISSLVPNEKMETSKKMPVLLTVLVIITLNMKWTNSFMDLISMTYNSYWMSIIMMVMMIMILLSFIFKMLFEPFKSMKST